MTRLLPDVTRCVGVSIRPGGPTCPDRDRCALHLDAPAGVMLSFVALRRDPAMRAPCPDFVEYRKPSA